MGRLLQDIEAIFEITKRGREILPVGQLTNSAGISTGISYCNTADIQLYNMKEMFEGSLDSDKRIAIACLDDGWSTDAGAWAHAACRFCDNIAGVFVMDTFHFEKKSEDKHDDIEGRTAHLFSHLPESFINSGMPVLIDETGLVFDYMPTSSPLEHDERLSFMTQADFEADMDNMPIMNCRFTGWSYSSNKDAHFPFVDMNGDDEEEVAIQAMAGGRIRFLGEHSWFLLNDAGIQLVPSETGLRKISTFLNNVFGDVIDVDALGNLEWDGIDSVASPHRYLLNRGYEMLIGKDKIGWVKDAEHELRKARDICSALLAAMKDAGMKPKIRVEDVNDPAVISETKSLCDAIGAFHYVEAVLAGVPIDDVAA